MPTTDAKEKKPFKPRFEYYITKGTIPCRLDTSRIIAKRHVLVKCKPGELLLITGAGYSAGKRRADRLVKRTQQVIDRLAPLIKSPLFTITDRMSDFMDPGEFKVEKRKIATPSAETTG